MGDGATFMSKRKAELAPFRGGLELNLSCLLEIHSSHLYFFCFLEYLKAGTVLMACKSRTIMELVRYNPFKDWGECLRSDYEGQTKLSVTGGQTDWPIIVCSIIRYAKLHAKVVLSIMKFFYLFVSCLLCNCPRRLCKVSRCRNNHSTVYQTHEPTSRDIMSRVCGEHSTSRRQVSSW